MLTRVRYQGKSGELRDMSFGSALVHFDGDAPNDAVWVRADMIEREEEVPDTSLEDPTFDEET